jgi:hypothetical protein
MRKLLSAAMTILLSAMPLTTFASEANGIPPEGEHFSACTGKKGFRSPYTIDIKIDTHGYFTVTLTDDATGEIIVRNDQYDIRDFGVKKDPKPNPHLSSQFNYWLGIRKSNPKTTMFGRLDRIPGVWIEYREWTMDGKEHTSAKPLLVTDCIEDLRYDEPRH